MRIVDIADVKLTVSEDNYNYYWRQRSVGENSDSFKTACRRILGLGVYDHNLNTSYIRSIIWCTNNKDIEISINKIIESGIVDYEEKWCRISDNNALKGASYTSLREQQLMTDVDEEFEDDVLIHETEDKIKRTLVEKLKSIKW